MTNRQQSALDFIVKNQKATVVGPSIRELAAHLGVFPNAAQHIVAALRRSGHVAPNNRKGLVAITTEDTMRRERAPMLKPSGRIA